MPGSDASGYWTFPPKQLDPVLTGWVFFCPVYAMRSRRLASEVRSAKQAT